MYLVKSPNHRYLRHLSQASFPAWCCWCCPTWWKRKWFWICFEASPFHHCQSSVISVPEIWQLFCVLRCCAQTLQEKHESGSHLFQDFKKDWIAIPIGIKTVHISMLFTLEEEQARASQGEPPSPSQPPWSDARSRRPRPLHPGGLLSVWDGWDWVGWNGYHHLQIVNYNRPPGILLSDLGWET